MEDRCGTVSHVVARIRAVDSEASSVRIEFSGSTVDSVDAEPVRAG